MGECARLAREAVAEGMCAVIGLQSTGEANMTSAREDAGNPEELDDFVSAPRVVLQQLLEKHFPLGRGGVSVGDLNILQAKVCKLDIELKMTLT